MDKLLLLSIVFGMLGIPVWASHDPLPKRGIRKLIFALVVLDLAYMLGLLFIYPRLI
ncbi:MAG: hypothetical protein R3C68_14020 [Myxococcota bacterium]